MSAAIDASQILRPGLLEGVSLLLAGPSPEADDSLAAAVGVACAALGAQVARWAPEVSPAAVDMLVFDGAAVFASARAGDGAAASGASRAALSACLDTAWEATHAVVNGAFLATGRPGRIMYLAPRPDAGAHAEPARAGLENLARTLSIEWARHGVTTVAIALGTATSAGEVGALVAYLASDAGAYFSGCLLDLRGPAAG